VANLGNPDRIVYTGALASDNAEMLEAETRAIPTIKRAQLLGELMDLRRGVAVAGTHGKTTTSAMIAWVLSMSGREPSYMIGGTIRGLGQGGHWGRGEELVAEADEYDRSFHHLRPQVGVITNIESDHLEYYGSMDAIFEAFKGFACNVREGGVLILCADDVDAMILHDMLLDERADFRAQTYGFGESALWRAVGVTPNGRGGSAYTAVYDEEEVARVSLAVPGAHNVLNSLAVLAACVELGVEAEEVARHLGEFKGAGRRFEVKGGVWDMTVVDDYAHHPTEITATLKAARQRFRAQPLIVVFQPHTYTRTRDFLDDFASALEGADHVIVTEIYASRERDTLGMSGKMIVERIRATPAEFAPTLDDAVEAALAAMGKEGSVLLTMGAGDVWKVGDEVLRRLGAGGK
jgi:UDP-N-acetylmuramate--alanine ligase